MGSSPADYKQVKSPVSQIGFQKHALYRIVAVLLCCCAVVVASYYDGGALYRYGLEKNINYFLDVLGTSCFLPSKRCSDGPAQLCTPVDPSSLMHVTPRKRSDGNKILKSPIYVRICPAYFQQANRRFSQIEVTPHFSRRSQAHGTQSPTFFHEKYSGGREGGVHT